MHLDASVGLDAPAEIRAAPGREVMAAGSVPEKAQDVSEVFQIQSLSLMPRVRERFSLFAFRSSLFAFRESPRSICD